METTVEEARLLVTRLKGLSSTQSATLKEHLLKKVADVSELVQKSLDSLSSDPRLAEFKVAFLALCLDNRGSATGFPYGKELDQLRKAVDSAENADGLSSNSKLTEITDDRIQLLEKENGNLRELLQQVKLELITKINDDARIDTMQDKLQELMKQMKDMETKFESEKAILQSEKDALQQRLMTDLAIVREKLNDTKSSYLHLTIATTKDLQDMKQDFSFLVGSLLGRCRNLSNTLNDMQEKYRKESMERKKLHNLVLELKGNIRVFVRVPSLGDL